MDLNYFIDVLEMNKISLEGSLARTNSLLEKTKFLLETERGLTPRAPDKAIHEASLQKPEFAIIGDIQIQYCNIADWKAGKRETYTKWLPHKEAIEFLKEQLPS